MYTLTSRDIWFSTDPREREAALWEEFEDKYLDRATASVVDALTETLPASLTSRAWGAIAGKLRALVEALDAEAVLTWGHEVDDDIPSFEQWRDPERAA